MTWCHGPRNVRRKPIQPPNGGLLNTEFNYTHSSQSDIRVTFERARAALGAVTTVRVPYQRLQGMARKAGA